MIQYIVYNHLFVLTYIYVHTDTNYLFSYNVVGTLVVCSLIFILFYNNFFCRPIRRLQSDHVR